MDTTRLNLKRATLAAVAVVIAALAYEIVVYGVLLQRLHAPHYGTLLRMDADVNHGGVMALVVAGAAVVTLFYSQFARGRTPGLGTGALFGASLGVMASVIPQLTQGLILQSWPFASPWALAGFGEHLVVGVVLGLTYRGTSA